MTEIYFNLLGNSRESYRKNLILKFLEEKAGSGTGELSSKYIYYVETTATGKKIYLLRPANLNKGMDFTVHLKDVQFRLIGPFKDRPTHSEIIQDLILKKEENNLEYEKVKPLINKLFLCQAVSDEEYRNLHFSKGIEIEGILKIIKWLFIEQDITYWNFSGRKMLYESLRINNLV
ncbi:hypothetical protein H9X75_03100 [Fusobacterium mortiferum]|uniref:hypothetical protein n=1 Tax=uncultured Fusobacterium sp. TaxID=159267 RepID=UPI00195968F5|nr:hypothetical protein [uncultured Fusobacterium sp.]MBM6690062.1 hypothetical protein [Fusobacterium mortiferum]